ncbi:MAG TPA: glucose 1-dehydrogenase [Candidatus Bathyarchaeia archaeon]|nr:glucose 1-dehydrogenase [Candidatus Bathyarchaeia archaeon]
MAKRLENKVSIVTGGGSGIGRATALLFAKEGSKVVVADIDDKAGSSTADAIASNAGESIFVHTDVTISSDADRLVSQCIKRFGRLDVLFNNAGIIVAGTVVSTPEDAWDRVMEVNVKGVYLCSKYAIPVMVRQGGGSIVNTASVLGLVASKDDSAYVTSKGAVVQLTKSMALDFGKDNIRVNCVCAGNTDTPMIDYVIRQHPEQPRDKMLEYFWNQNAVIKRPIKAEEVASVVLFLASDESSAVTGSTYLVDGGWSAI